MRSINNIPQDDATKKKILDIIDHQFDLEIYLKYRERDIIRKEINKAQNTLRDLQAAIENESLAGESTHYTRRSAAVATLANALYQSNLSNGPPQPQQQPPYYYYNNRSNSHSQRNQGLFGRRADGVYVRLSCPVCKRDDFANRQGFLNHCRLSHKLEFGPYEQTMIQCGTPVDESQVPMDDPCRSRPITMPIPPIKQKKKERPSIKVFEEDVDLESTQEKNNHSTPPAPPPPPSTTTTTHVTEGSKSIPDTIIKQEDASTSALTNNKEIIESIKKPTMELCAATTPISTTTTPPSLTTTTTTTNNNNNNNDIGSRFYIKRQIVIGNVSKFILPEKRDPTLNKFTHKWMVYIVEPPQTTTQQQQQQQEENEGISKFITGVRFHLHPSYKPHDIVDVTEPPFRLTRLAWGEFPIRVQLFFVDKKRNKSIDLIHQVKLDYTHSGRQMLGGERIVEIELDRNTDFNDLSTKPIQKPTLTSHDESLSEQEKQKAMAIASKQKMSLLHGILKDCIRRLPIIRPASQSGSLLPYTCATGPKHYFRWTIGRRKALEWHRAHLLRIKVQQCSFDTMDPVLRSAGAALSTKDVIVWCRENGFTPLKSDLITNKTMMEDEKYNEPIRGHTREEEEDTVGFGYCKFCGCYRNHKINNSTEDTHCRQRPSQWNSRKRALNSVSSVNTLLDQLPTGWDTITDDDDDMDVDVDIGSSHPTLPKTTNNTTTTTTTITGEENKRTTLIGKSLLKTLREQIQKEEPSTLFDETCLDWIWSVISELKLKSMIANDIIQERDGTLRGPTHDFNIMEAMDQRLVTGHLFSTLVKLFLKKLLGSGLNVYYEQQKRKQQQQQQEEMNKKKEEEEEEEGQTTLEKLLVPVHIYEGIQKIPTFDFLTNQYMGPPPPSTLSNISLLPTLQQQKRKQKEEEEEQEDIVMK